MKLLSKTLLIITASFVFIPAHAEEAWPNHPVKFIVGFGPGGANDLVARVVAEGVSKQLNQTVIVENHQRIHCGRGVRGNQDGVHVNGRYHVRQFMSE